MGMYGVREGTNKGRGTGALDDGGTGDEESLVAGDNLPRQTRTTSGTVEEAGIVRCPGGRRRGGRVIWQGDE